AVTVHLLTAPRIYQATARVLIEAEKQNIVSFKEVVEQSQTSDTYYQTQYNLLASQALAAKTLDNWGLWEHSDFGGPGPGRRRALPAAFGGALAALSAPARQVFGRPAPADSPESGDTLKRSRAIDIYLRQLIISPL